MSHGTRSRPLPLSPLVGAFVPSARTPKLTLSVQFLDTATDEQLSEALRAFAGAVLPVAFHNGLIAERMKFLRHALNHLFRGSDPLPERVARCASSDGVYFVAGIGPALWAALAECAQPDVPRWSPSVERGLLRLGLLREIPTDTRIRFDAVCRGCAVVREHRPNLSAADVSEFLERVSRLESRELPPADPDGFAWGATASDLEHAVRTVRSRLPLKARVRQTAGEQAAHVARFHAHGNAGEWEAALTAFRAAFPEPRWEAALPAVDDAYGPSLPDADRGRLLCDITTALRERFKVHPFELADVVVAVADGVEPVAEPNGFGGFCSDSFQFLTELAETNTTDWMTDHRDRYQFVLREPLIELCEQLAERYIQPVLNREYGWDLECDARSGRAVTSICKNDFGRTGPYQPVQWVTFYRRSKANKRSDAQLFVRVAPDGVGYGFHLGRTARDAGKQFRRNIQEHGEAIFRALQTGNVLTECRFWTGDDLAAEVAVKCAADLRAWAAHKSLAVGKRLPSGAPLLRREELSGEVLLTFDRLLPLFAAAAEPDPRPLLRTRAGEPAAPPLYNSHSFRVDTYLSEIWLDRVFGLLRMKKQLVLQGVPGTGKTHVARCLARLLTHDRPDCVRLVQFHPAYSYEEFVEGIRARGADVNGQSQVTFPVEPGVLCQFAEQAASHPSEPHILIIDELNRGNLPRIFGELLYLLEYRDQAITLPYSKREFRLPDNLFVLATMNPLDRSAVALDGALRRRFSFVDMPADAAILAAWLEARSPDADPTFGPQVVRLFEELNRRLTRDAGSDKQVGHSFFMVPDLSGDRLAAVWDHHVRPLLLDYLGGREDRLREYTPERLLGAPKRKPVTTTGD